MPPNKRRKLSPPEEDSGSSVGKNRSALTSSFAKNASQWNLEQDYENRPRHQNKQKATNRLPIKTQEGLVEEYTGPEAEDEEEEESGSASSGLEDGTPDTEEVEDDAPTEAGPKLSPREVVIEAKEELARIAALINEDPEEHIGALRTLGHITASDNATVTKLGLVTQCAVYKDIIPGYRIRPLSEQDGSVKVSKDVRKLRTFEQSIVAGYHKYVKELQRIAGLPRFSEAAISMATIALRCACDLVNSVPHFNYRSDLLKIIVDKLARRSVDGDFILAREALEKLFAEDEDGNASLEAVGLLSKMIRAKTYQLHESVLNTFLSLRLLSEFNHKGSAQKISRDKTDDANAPALKPSNKDFKKQKERMSKKEKKAFRERREIEKEMKEADATVAHEERDQNQGETLKLVFGIYFRVLKAGVPALTGAVLEGLVKFAHLINQQFFGDLLEALKELITDAENSADNDPEDAAEDAEQEIEQDEEQVRNMTRESLLCVITAFALLQGQDASGAASSLHLDLDFFTTQLYRTLYPAALNADIERSHKSLHLPDPHDPGSKKETKVNVQTTIVLLLRSLTAVLLPSNTRSVPPVRLAAFLKQLQTATLHLPEKSATAMLGLSVQVTKTHKKRAATLWNTEERKGDGVFDPLRAQIEGSNPFAATVWEGELLRLHYAPSVREGVRNLEGIVKGVLQG